MITEATGHIFPASHLQTLRSIHRSYAEPGYSVGTVLSVRQTTGVTSLGRGVEIIIIAGSWSDGAGIRQVIGEPWPARNEEPNVFHRLSASKRLPLIRCMPTE